jgi:hypothetical protein
MWHRNYFVCTNKMKSKQKMPLKYSTSECMSYWPNKREVAHISVSYKRILHMHARYETTEEQISGLL